MYDMYPWDRPASSTGSAHADQAASAPRAAEGARAAVQVALDRRDNGGDAAATAASAAAATAGAVATAHRPPAGATRS